MRSLSMHPAKHILSALLLLISNYCYAQGVSAHPIKDFLKVPVTRLEIEGSTRGCFGGSRDYISFKLTKDTTYLMIDTMEVSELVDAKGNKIPSRPFDRMIQSSVLRNVLLAIDTYPGKIPQGKDFQITPSDKQEFNDFAHGPHYKESDGSLYEPSAEWKDLYYSLMSRIDTFSANTFKEYLDHKYIDPSTLEGQFSIWFTNANKEVLYISHDFDGAGPGSTHLPWTITYQGRTFKYYDPGFSRFIDSCLPSHFMYKHTFSNKYFLKEFAYYLSDKTR